jgi:hypothetical protein
MKLDYITNDRTDQPLRRYEMTETDISDDVPCQPNNLGFCKWCGKDMQ